MEENFCKSNIGSLYFCSNCAMGDLNSVHLYNIYLAFLQFRIKPLEMIKQSLLSNNSLTTMIGNDKIAQGANAILAY